MKLSLVMLVVYMLSLSFAGFIRPQTIPAKPACCAHMAKAGKKEACPGMPDQKDNPCSKPGCLMMFTCSICGFICPDAYRVQAAPVVYVAGYISHYRTGRLTAYNAPSWKPPKAC